MKEKLKNTLIGLFVIAAVVIIVMMILFLKPSVGDGKKTYTVRFSNISGVSDGTRVTFAGRPVGEVESIVEIPDARQQPTDELGRVYFYQLKLKVDSSVEIYNTDEITISTTGLMGEKSIAIVPKAPPRGVTPKLITDQVIYGESVDALQRVLHELSILATSVETTITEFNEWFMENREDMSIAIQAFGDSMKELDQVLASVNQQNIVANVREAIEVMTDDLKLVRSTLQEVQDTDMVGKFNTVLENVAETSEAFNIDGRQILCNLNVITQDIADGTGTLGKIIKGDDLYLRITAMMNKADTVLNDINHYGLLFQYDKSWQRQRTRRANLLEALDTPRQFRNYFETEVDSITTSLSRISILLEKADSSEERARIMSSITFKKDFASLMRQVQSLNDSLKLYNEQLIDEDCN